MTDEQRTALTLDYERFRNLTYEGFRALATAEGLSRSQRIGFPDAYRSGREAAILADITAKLTRLDGAPGVVLDIGPGCGELADRLIERCQERGHRLLLCDSPEMLARLPARPGIEKFPGRYPSETGNLVRRYAGRVDVILCYSVLQYVPVGPALEEFIDRTLELLATGGQLLFGDLPNASKRRRYFHSAAGQREHRRFTGGSGAPVAGLLPMPGQLDDQVLIGLLTRCRAAGLDAFLMPQAAGLPLATRREDLLVCKP